MRYLIMRCCGCIVPVDNESGASQVESLKKEVWAKMTGEQQAKFRGMTAEQQKQTFEALMKTHLQHRQEQVASMPTTPAGSVPTTPVLSAAKPPMTPQAWQQMTPQQRAAYQQQQVDLKASCTSSLRPHTLVP